MSRMTLAIALLTTATFAAASGAEDAHDVGSGAYGAHGAGSRAASAFPGPSICGQVRIATGLASKVPDDAVLFIFAKPKLGGGAPTAVFRDEVFLFPVQFCLSQKNTMAEGMRFEGAQYVTARLDFDGNAGGAPGDLEGVTKTPIAVGTSGLVLTIDTVRP